MEEKLRLFISENSSVPQSDEGDGTLCFVHKQIVTLAHDCLDKCHNQLLSALYFHELSENLKQLTMDVSFYNHRITYLYLLVLLTLNVSIHYVKLFTVDVSTTHHGFKYSQPDSMIICGVLDIIDCRSSKVYVISDQSCVPCYIGI